eukprot:s689_g20.t1
MPWSSQSVQWCAMVAVGFLASEALQRYRRRQQCSAVRREQIDFDEMLSQEAGPSEGAVESWLVLRGCRVGTSLVSRVIKMEEMDQFSIVFLEVMGRNENNEMMLMLIQDFKCMPMYISESKNENAGTQSSPAEAKPASDEASKPEEKLFGLRTLLEALQADSSMGKDDTRRK